MLSRLRQTLQQLARRRVTFIVLSDLEQEPKAIAKSQLALLGLAIAFAILLMGQFAAIAGYGVQTAKVIWLAASLRSLQATKEQLVQERQVQEEKFLSLAQKASELERKLESLDQIRAEMVRYLRGKGTLVGTRAPTAPPAQARGGQGGPADALLDVEAWTVRELSELDGQMTRMKARFEDLQPELVSLNERLKHTPSGWPVRGYITSSFGPRRHPITGAIQLHRGVDIAAPLGAQVIATADGRVTYAGWSAGYGNMVIIDQGYGIKTVYGHNSRILVKAGQRVQRGQAVALVGNTGLSTGPHLHYEVRVNDRAVDPVQYLRNE